MSEVWLKLIGTGKDPCEENYAFKKEFADFSISKRPNDVHPGDQLVLYAAGGSRYLFALAEVISEVRDVLPGGYEGKDYKTYPYRVDIKYIFRVPVSAGIHINEITTPKRNLPGAIRRSYIKLKPEEFESAVSKLQRAEQIYEAGGGE
jgi:hypothetical protein